MEDPANVEGLVDAALTLLVEARKRSQDAPAGSTVLDGDQERRLGVAISAAHTVIEPPNMPTPELRAMGLWWDE